MSNAPTCIWRGKSGNPYKYWVHPIGTSMKDTAGNYIYAYEYQGADGSRYWRPVYIGEGNLKDRSDLGSHHRATVSRTTVPLTSTPTRTQANPLGLQRKLTSELTTPRPATVSDSSQSPVAMRDQRGGWPAGWSPAMRPWSRPVPDDARAVFRRRPRAGLKPR